jgi:hypothetical protein
MKKIILGLILDILSLFQLNAQCDFFENISVITSGYNATVGFSQNYVLVSSVAGSPSTIVGINGTGNFSNVAQGAYFIYAVNIQGSIPPSLAVGANWNNFVNTSGDLCKEISVPYLNREVYVCGLDNLCSPNEIVVSASGYTASNTQMYVLCSSNPETILAYNTTGIFSSSDYDANEGIFVLYAVNTSNSDVLNSIQVNNLFSNVRIISGSECADVSVPKAFDIENCSALPIQLTHFDAEPIGEDVLLSWETSSEINNDYFTLEKTQDFQHWIPFATIKGAGNSSSILNYDFIDKNPYQGDNYYRLKQTDYDGFFTFSEIKHVFFTSKNSLLVFPNPTKDFMKIRTSQEIIKTEIYSMLNQIIQINYKNELIDVRNLSSGQYLLKVYYKNGYEFVKFLVTN